MEKKEVKELLAFLLNSFRARMAIQDVSQGCPFDYGAFLEACRAIKSDPYLANLLTVQLNWLVTQGLLDSLLPYLKGSFRTRPALLAIEGPRQGPLPSTSRTSRSRQTPERAEEDPDIAIHVCDEGKGLWKDFSCRQSVLLKGMGYFSRVTVKGQRLQDMDISVHCEIGIFDWLLQWIQKQGQGSSSPVPDPGIDPLTVIGLVVSADFLQMPSLTATCLEYIVDNIEYVIRDSPNLGCLSEPLTRRLAGLLTNAELETRVTELDRTDRLASRLYIQFIMLLNSVDPDPLVGHYASSASLFRCSVCSQLLTNEVAPLLPCKTVKFDSFGRHFSVHVKDNTWSLAVHVRELKREFKTWRRVYWRLWGTVHYFLCSVCHFYYPARFTGTCRFHPDPKKGTEVNSSFGQIKSQAFQKHFHKKAGHPVPESPNPKPEDDSQSQVVRKFPCCKAPSYRFTPLTHMQGCQSKDHDPSATVNRPAGKLDTFSQFLDLIVEDEEDQQAWTGIMSNFKTEKSWSLMNAFQDSGRSGVSEYELESHSCYSGSEDGGEGTGRTPRSTRHESLWSWNPDLTTRWNQDMQRELEEKFMLNLCSLMAQRIPFVDNHGVYKF